MKKLILSALILTLSAWSTLSAQSNSSSKQKKSVTIEKHIDKDGNEIIEKTIKEGDAVKGDMGDKGSKSVKIYADSMGKGTKIIIDENIKITDDEDEIESNSFSRSNFTERTVTIKKNADGSVEIKENSGDDILNRANVRVDSAEAKKPNIGVSLDDEMRITSVISSGAAEAAGLKRDDVITHFDGTFVEDYDHLKELLSKKKVGDKVSITYLRERKEMKATVTLKGGSTRVYFNR